MQYKHIISLSETRLHRRDTRTRARTRTHSHTQARTHARAQARHNCDRNNNLLKRIAFVIPPLSKLTISKLTPNSCHGRNLWVVAVATRTRPHSTVIVWCERGQRSEPTYRSPNELLMSVLIYGYIPFPMLFASCIRVPYIADVSLTVESEISTLALLTLEGVNPSWKD